AATVGRSSNDFLCKAPRTKLILLTRREMLRRKPPVFHQLFNESRYVWLRRDVSHNASSDTKIVSVASGEIEWRPPEVGRDIELRTLVHQELNGLFRSALSGSV